MAETHVNAFVGAVDYALKDARDALNNLETATNTLRERLNGNESSSAPAPEPAPAESSSSPSSSSKNSKPAGPRTVKEAAASTTTTPLSRPKTRGSGRREPFSAT